jgi:hypothetical protein
MKRIITIFATVLLIAGVFAQAPQKMSYQAVIRNSTNKLVVSAPVGMRISILQGTATGTAVYVETQMPTTNANGLASLEIGSGTIVSGTFSAIDWSAGPYFIKTETDPAGGTDYSISGTSELLSVPYAFYSANGVPVHYIGESYGGGKVFYVYDGGRHGLIAATTDQSTGNWGPNITTNAIRDSINAGQSNTERIIINVGPGAYAAPYSANYKGGGFGDWYLPSKYEIKLLYAQRAVVGGFADVAYWSSCEVGAGDAWAQDFADPPYGGQSQSIPKSTEGHVRAIRAF